MGALVHDGIKTHTHEIENEKHEIILAPSGVCLNLCETSSRFDVELVLAQLEILTNMPCTSTGVLVHLMPQALHIPSRGEASPLESVPRAYRILYMH